LKHSSPDQSEESGNKSQFILEEQPSEQNAILNLSNTLTLPESFQRNPNPSEKDAQLNQSSIVYSLPVKSLLQNMSSNPQQSD